MTKAFTPIGLVLGLAAGQLSKKIFDKVWGLIRDEEAPRPKHRELSLITLVSALIVAVIWAAVAGVMALLGRTRMQKSTPPIPEQSVESVKEDVQWTKTSAQRGRR